MLKKILPKKLFPTQESNEDRKSQSDRKKQSIQILQNQNIQKQKHLQAQPQKNYKLQNKSNQQLYAQLSNPEKMQNYEKKSISSSAKSSYYTVKGLQHEEKHISNNQKNSQNYPYKIQVKQKQNQYVDDDDNDFRELLQQFDPLNISQILPRQGIQQNHSKSQNDLMISTEMQNSLTKSQKQKDNSINRPQFLKIIKEINRQQKKQQLNKMFHNLTQLQTKSLILGSYINKLLSDPALNFLKQIPQHYPGSTRIPKQQKRVLLMFFQEVIEQVGLDANYFTPKGYKWKIQENVKQTINFSKKIQTHFTARKKDMIYKLTQYYMNIDYIHIQAKKILYRNLQKITKQHKQYRQKIRNKTSNNSQKVQKASNKKNKQVLNRANSQAANSQDGELFQLRSQINKITTQSQANRVAKYQDEEQIRSIGMYSQNNYRFGYASGFELRSSGFHSGSGTPKQKQKNTQINNNIIYKQANMSKNLKRCFTNKDDKMDDNNQKVDKKYQDPNYNKSKQKQYTHKFSQISKSLQKWNQKQKQKIDNINHNISKNSNKQKINIQAQQSQGHPMLSSQNQLHEYKQTVKKGLKISQQFGINLDLSNDTQPVKNIINNGLQNTAKVRQMNPPLQKNYRTDKPNPNNPHQLSAEDKNIGNSYSYSYIQSNLSSDQQVNPHQNNPIIQSNEPLHLPDTIHKNSPNKVGDTNEMDDSLTISMSVTNSQISNSAKNNSKNMYGQQNNTIPNSNYTSVDTNTNKNTNNSNYGNNTILRQPNSTAAQTIQGYSTRWQEDTHSNSSDSSDSSDAEYTITSHNTQLLDLSRFINKRINTSNNSNNNTNSNSNSNGNSNSNNKPQVKLQQQQQQQQYSSWKSDQQQQSQSPQQKPKNGEYIHAELFQKRQQKIARKQQQPYLNTGYFVPVPPKQQVNTQRNNIINNATMKNHINSPSLQINSANNKSSPSYSIPSSITNAWQPYTKISSYLKKTLNPPLITQFQSNMQTYYNSKPAFHVQPRRKMLDFLDQVCQQVISCRKLISSMNNREQMRQQEMADKGVRLGVEVCGYLSEDKIAQMKNTYRLYYKDYFKVDERRIMFGDLSHIIKLYKQSQ